MLGSRVVLGDPGNPAPIVPPTAGVHPPSHRSSSPTPAPPVPGVPAAGVPSQPSGGLSRGKAAQRSRRDSDLGQGFLASQVPWLLAVDPLSLHPPFETPGDAFLQFALENFSSSVCSSVACGSPLFAPSLVHLAARHSNHQHVSLHSVCSML
jgi:hypothetical protein